jgi:hypothetical protein
MIDMPYHCAPESATLCETHVKFSCAPLSLSSPRIRYLARGPHHVPCPRHHNQANEILEISTNKHTRQSTSLKSNFCQLKAGTTRTPIQSKHTRPSSSVKLNFCQLKAGTHHSPIQFSYKYTMAGPLAFLFHRYSQ